MNTNNMNTESKRLRTYERVGQIEDIIREHWEDSEKANPEDFQNPMEVFLKRIEEKIRRIRIDVDQFQNNPSFWTKDDKRDMSI